MRARNRATGSFGAEAEAGVREAAIRAGAAAECIAAHAMMKPKGAGVDAAFGDADFKQDGAAIVMAERFGTARRFILTAKSEKIEGTE